MSKFLKSKKFIIGLIAIIIISVIGYFTYINATTVAVEQVYPKTIKVEKTISASGVIDSANSADLAFNSISKLTKINVKEGDTVKKGQLLASADSSSSYLSAQATKSQIEQIELDKKKYISDYASNLEGAGGRKTYEYNLQKFDESINQLKATYNAQITSLSNYYIYAPFDGTVIEITKKPGETVATGETIIKIANLSNLYFIANVDQEDLRLITLDKPAIVTLDAFDNKEFTGKISNIQNFLKEGTKTVEIQVTLDNIDTNVYYGMTGDTKIIIDSKQTDSAIQFDYFVTDQNKTYIWTVKNNKLVKKPVTIDFEGDIYSTVKEDLNNLVLVTAKDTNKELNEGMRVNVEQP